MPHALRRILAATGAGVLVCGLAAPAVASTVPEDLEPGELAAVVENMDSVDPRFDDDPGTIQAAPTALLGLDVDADGNLYLADLNGNYVAQAAPDGSTSIVAGTGEAGDSGDGGPAEDAELDGPADIAVADDGTLYIADSSNQRVRAVDPDGTITTVAGGGNELDYIGGIPAEDAKLDSVGGLAVDSEGNLYISSLGQVLEVDPDGTLSMAAYVSFNIVQGMAVDAEDNLYIADTGAQAVWMIGPGTSTSRVVDADDYDTPSFRPDDVAVGADGTLYVADRGASRVYRFTSDGVLAAITGGVDDSAFSGTRMPALEARLDAPGGLALDADGNLLVSQNSRTVVAIADPGEAPVEPFNSAAGTEPEGDPVAPVDGSGSLEPGADSSNPLGVLLWTAGILGAVAAEVLLIRWLRRSRQARLQELEDRRKRLVDSGA